ncbi:MAG: tripartite tricarboxylate transporter substrate binding protein [Betaproteobacteria bacterium]|nr:tripartite tricarboxylate transporter substrate binding protein [Betaproteobacteria bacterium]
MKLSACLEMAGMAAMLAAAVANAVFAQTYPYRPVRFIVPYAAGGATDILTRVIEPGLSERLGQRVVVDNRPGAGAIVGTSLLAKATPDGYTIMMAEIAQGANPALHSKLPYNTLKDFASVTLVALMPTVLVVPPSLAVTSVGELIALAKSRPGQLNYSSSGYGSANFLAAELFKSATGIKVVHIPYQGGSQALAAILGNQAQMLFTTLPPSIPHIKAGRVRALALGGRTRTPLLPDVPTVAESAVPDFQVYLWLGVLAPAGTSRQIITRLNSEIKTVLTLPRVRERIAGLGAEIVGSTPQQLTDHIKSEIARWTKVITPDLRVD